MMVLNDLPELLINHSPNSNHWLLLNLVIRAHSSTDVAAGTVQATCLPARRAAKLCGA